MCAEKSGQVDVVEALVLKQSVETVCTRMHIWQKPVRCRFRAVRPADVRLDLRATWAGHDGVCAREMDHIRNANAALPCERSQLPTDILEAVVLGASSLVGQAQAAVGAAGAALSLIPRPRVVESATDSCACVIVALPAGEEHRCEVRGDG